MRRTSWTLSALVWGTVALTGCPDGDALPTCTYDGQPRMAGAAFRATDGCNTCSCDDSGQVQCTLIACHPGTPGTCDYGGKTYKVGDSFPADDGCNSCVCGDTGALACTRKSCVPTNGCVRAGCSGQLCVEAGVGSDIATTCEWRAEYGCYRQAPCERQADGRCGHTQSDELKQCLAMAQGQCMTGGVTYQVGQTFPSPDNCNTCTCIADGRISCTEIACPVACQFLRSYQYGAIGGLVAYVNRSYLTPVNLYRHDQRYYTQDLREISCAPAMPACNTAGVVTARDIEAHLADPDVQHALSLTTPPLFGRDVRPVDGTVFEFQRDDGCGFLVGADCASPAQSSCWSAPAGIKRLVDRLLELDRQQLASDVCTSAGF